MARTITGTVTSDKADKTIVISVKSRKTHPLYKKQYTFTTKFMAHDPKNEAKIGDMVVISETKPISAQKRFKLDKVVEKAGIKFEENDGNLEIEANEVMLKQEAKPAKEPKADVPKVSKEAKD